MRYLSFLDELRGLSEEDFAIFQRKLIFTKQTVLGIRTPVMRSIAKKYKGEIESIFAFPDEYYETTFIKLAIVASLPYSQFVAYLPRCVDLMDNWATCDMFKAKCIAKNREAFLPVLQLIFDKKTEFAERYVLVTLLGYYMDKEYYDTVLYYLRLADYSKYYVYMAAAWLLAELIVKDYEYGTALLQSEPLPTKTRNKAIQKALESYRLNKEQKERLRSLKIK